MIAEEKQDDLSMEDILSSIKDILNSETQETGNALPQTGASVAAPMPEVIEKAEEEDVFDLSKDMIIDDKELADLNLNANNFDINLNDLAAESADINLEEFETQTDSDEILDLTPASSSQSEAETEAETETPDFVIPEIDNLTSLDDFADLDFDTETEIKIEPQAEEIIPALTAEPQPVKETIVEAEPVIEPEIEAVTEIELPAPESQELLDDRADAPFLSATAEIEAEPIFSAEEDAVAADNAAINIPTPEETTAITDFMAEPAYEAGEDTMQNITTEPLSEVDSSNIDEILSSASEVIEADAPDSEEKDAVDASADIINNFARMFAANAGERDDKSSEISSVGENIIGAIDEQTELGNGSKTIEQVVQDVIRQIIGEAVSTKFKAVSDLDSYARAEIKAQTAAWLDKNLPAVVESAVQKEIQRVMAKVGK